LKETAVSNAKRDNLVQVKSALAEKYDALARAAGSVVKRRQFLHHAEKYRRQVAQLARA
jgi:hypothetical protein